MLSKPQKIAVTATLALASAGVAASAGMTSSAAGSPALQRKAAVQVSIVPGVIGPGSGLQSANAAKWAVIGKYAPNKAGKKVVLQRQSGSAWKTVDKSEVGNNGQVVFPVRPPKAEPLLAAAEV